MLMVVSYRWECDREKIAGARDAILRYCQDALNRLGPMDVDPAWDADLENKFRTLTEQVLAG